MLLLLEKLCSHNWHNPRCVKGCTYICMYLLHRLSVLQNTCPYKEYLNAYLFHSIYVYSMYGIYCAVVMIFTFRIGCSHLRICMVRAMNLPCIVHVTYHESLKIGLKNCASSTLSCLETLYNLNSLLALKFGQTQKSGNYEILSAEEQ